MTTTTSTAQSIPAQPAEPCPDWCIANHPADSLHIRELDLEAESTISLDLVQEYGQPPKLNVWLSGDFAESWPVDPGAVAAAGAYLTRAAETLRNLGLEA